MLRRLKQRFDIAYQLSIADKKRGLVLVYRGSAGVYAVFFKLFGLNIVSDYCVFAVFALIRADPVSGDMLLEINGVITNDGSAAELIAVKNTNSLIRQIVKLQ